MVPPLEYRHPYLVVSEGGSADADIELAAAVWLRTERWEQLRRRVPRDLADRADDLVGNSIQRAAAQSPVVLFRIEVLSENAVEGLLFAVARRRLSDEVRSERRRRMGSIEDSPGISNPWVGRRVRLAGAAEVLLALAETVREMYPLLAQVFAVDAVKLLDDLWQRYGDEQSLYLLGDVAWAFGLEPWVSATPEEERGPYIAERLGMTLSDADQARARKRSSRAYELLRAERYGRFRDALADFLRDPEEP
ncbi:MAG: hypothetical protein HY909_17755 [Deltaproteobacteria bacterium]|nr:hypothetical protein [Deltaproteobacteria bacterium]